MRVPSPLPVLRAVNQLSLLFEAMLQRSLYSQNYVVIFSFSVHFSEAESIPQAQWEESNTCCDSLSILVQIACLRDFKITSAVPAKKKKSLFFHFPDAGNGVLLSHSTLLPHVGQQGCLSRSCAPLWTYKQWEGKGDILCCDSPIGQCWDNICSLSYCDCPSPVTAFCMMGWQ